MRLSFHTPVRGLATAVLATALLAEVGCNRADDDAALPADAANAQVDPSATNVPADDTMPADATSDGMAETSLTVSTLEGVEGAYVADGAGNALYFLEGDTDGSKCVDACTVAWMPVLVTAAQPSGAPGLDAARVATIQRADGGMQVTYNGHPLYRYSADSGAGSVNGHGVEDQWGHWYLLTPAGEEHTGAMAGGAGDTDDAEMAADAGQPAPEDANP